MNVDMLHSFSEPVFELKRQHKCRLHQKRQRKKNNGLPWQWCFKMSIILPVLSENKTKQKKQSYLQTKQSVLEEKNMSRFRMFHSVQMLYNMVKDNDKRIKRNKAF